ncbi:MAG TPA: carboxypeptidase-like regulatory domain-containing protein, partial [Puia sp.]
MKHLSILTSLLIAALAATAQNPAATQTIRGIITDRVSERPLAGVSVSIPELNIGTTTDSLGRYTLPAVPIGRRQITYGSVGYHSAVIPS